MNSFVYVDAERVSTTGSQANEQFASLGLKATGRRWAVHDDD